MNHSKEVSQTLQKAAGEIESNGGKVLCVQLHYGLKEKLYRKLGKAQNQNDGRNQRYRVAFVRELRLPVVNGKVASAVTTATQPTSWDIGAFVLP